MVSRAGTWHSEEATIADIHAAYRAGTCTVRGHGGLPGAHMAAYDKRLAHI